MANSSEGLVGQWHDLAGHNKNQDQNKGVNQKCRWSGSEIPDPRQGNKSGNLEEALSTGGDHSCTSGQEQGGS